MTGMEQISQTDADSDIRNAFDLFDADQSGYLSKKELRFAFKSMGATYITDKDVDEWFESADIDHDGKISFEEFSALLKKNMREAHSKDEIVHIFEEFSSGGGEITLGDLSRVTKYIFGEAQPEAELKRVMKWVKRGYQTDFPEAPEIQNITLQEFEYAGTKYDYEVMQQRHAQRKKRRDQEKKLEEESAKRRAKSPKSGSGSRAAPERPGTPDERRSSPSKGSRKGSSKGAGSRKGSSGKRSHPKAEGSRWSGLDEAAAWKLLIELAAALYQKEGGDMAKLNPKVAKGQFELFKLLDLNMSGAIEFADLQEVAKKVGEDPGEDLLKAMIEKQGEMQYYGFNTFVSDMY